MEWLLGGLFNNMNDWIAKDADYIMSTYPRHPVVIVKGDGFKVWDERGKEYLDFFSGISVCNLGHCHPEIIKAIEKQIHYLFHISNLYYTAPQIELAGLLVKNSFADKVFFCNSGAEANEAAIKLARLFGKQFSPPRYKIITMEGSFHGRTLATLTATGQEKVKKGFEPLPEGFLHIPFDDIPALRKAVDKETCAVMLEPIQGEGGVIVPSPQYLKDVKALCKEYGLLLILDEVQTGMGRTGHLFAYEDEGIKPDILTLAKSLANGLPIGAMLATDEVADFFSKGTHASTFGGNPIACAAAKVVMKTLVETDILDYCRQIGYFFKQQLEKLKEKYKVIKEVRGKGLMLAVELDTEAAPIVATCLERGYLINAVQEKVLRFLPPLIITKEAISDLISTLDEVIAKRKE